MTLYTRDDWGARSPRNPLYPVDSLDVFIVHYVGSASPMGQSFSGPSAVRSIQNQHMDTNGWNDIGYNGLVHPNGDRFIGRGLGIHNAANGTEINGRSQAICVLAGVGDPVTTEAIRGLSEFYTEYLGAGGRPAIIGHQDVETPPGTECPGSLYEAALPLIGSKSPPTPTPTPSEDDMGPYDFKLRYNHFDYNGEQWDCYDYPRVPAGTKVFVMPRDVRTEYNVVAFNATSPDGRNVQATKRNDVTPVVFTVTDGTTPVSILVPVGVPVAVVAF